jgi:hypothetical protein
MSNWFTLVHRYAYGNPLSLLVDVSSPASFTWNSSGIYQEVFLPCISSVRFGGLQDFALILRPDIYADWVVSVPYLLLNITWVCILCGRIVFSPLTACPTTLRLAPFPAYFRAFPPSSYVCTCPRSQHLLPECPAPDTHPSSSPTF